MRRSSSGGTVWLIAAAVTLAGCTSDEAEEPTSPVIDAGPLDAQIPLFDATVADGSHDAGPLPDAAVDATVDAGADATPDAAPDATPDAMPDATPDAEPDAMLDASDAGADAPACGEGGPVGTFADDFSQGVRPTYWTIDETSDAGLYTYAADAGALHFAKIGTSPGGTQNISASLDMAAVGGPVLGDFTMTVDFRDAVLGAVGTGIDQIELHASFEDASYFFDVYTNENGLEFHVWDGAFRTGFNTTVDAATLQIVRSGSTLTAYAITAGDGGSDAGAQVVFSKAGSTTALTGASFILQNYQTNNAISVTYDNFSLRGACVHP